MDDPPQLPGPGRALGDALDALATKIPKKPAAMLAMMAFFVCGLRWQPELEDPYKTVYMCAMLGGIVGMVALSIVAAIISLWQSDS